MKKQLIFILSAAMFILFAFLLCGCFNNQDIFKADNNLKLVSRVEGETLSYYADGKWHSQFLYGVNLGATTPGHHPGELSPNYDDYRRWFAGMEEAGLEVVRIYTVLPPEFYTALIDHNKEAKEKLWLIQGIWSPEEELIEELDAYLPEITEKFHREIDMVVCAVYGLGEILPTPGKASGNYTQSVAPYLLAWMVGTEWYPYMVDNTNEEHTDKKPFNGDYFTNVSQASPFEAWLAEILEKLAVLETEQGWQHPISFVNWVTTDPLSHPNEPFYKEDMVSVDPMHIVPTAKWQGGYFAAYHVYPYYPDLLRFQQEYQEYENKHGEKEPYEAYLVELKEHHAGIPLVISEFGIPSSRGMAHRGTLDRNQGMHTEKEQGEMVISMFEAMRNAGLAGGVLFAWQDEWFKHTWNTMDLELPSDRRPMWLNRLTNEENFGLVAVDPGHITRVYLDGDIKDWEFMGQFEKTEGGKHLPLKISSDEAYLYLAIQKPKDWDWSKESLYLAFDNQPGGNTRVTPSGPELELGAEFLLTIKNPKEGEITVASAYDQHTYFYGPILDMIPSHEYWGQEDNGLFLPWKLCLSRELYLPVSKETIPFDEIDVGILHPGISNPEDPDFNSLADFYIGEEWMEFRIPWMLLGYTDPSSHQVWAYPYREMERGFTPTTSPGISVQAISINSATGQMIRCDSPLAYDWENWDEPNYHERYKDSYYQLKDYIAANKP